MVLPTPFEPRTPELNVKGVEGQDVDPVGAIQTVPTRVTAGETELVDAPPTEEEGETTEEAGETETAGAPPTENGASLTTAGARGSITSSVRGRKRDTPAPVAETRTVVLPSVAAESADNLNETRQIPEQLGEEKVPSTPRGRLERLNWTSGIAAP